MNYNGNVNNRYFIHFDFYNMESKGGLTLISKFPTIQQTTDFTCGPCCLKMVFDYYGIDVGTEMDIATECSTIPVSGTKLLAMQQFAKKRGYESISTYDLKKDNNNKCFSNFEEFKLFVIENLSKGYPVVFENIDWAGHYKVCIGYDIVNDNYEEDMLIFADPSDFSDGLVDGYNYFPAERFFYMWFDDHCLEQEVKKQAFLVIKKKYWDLFKSYYSINIVKDI